MILQNHSMLSVKLKSWLDLYNLNPILIFEELSQDKNKENLRSETRNQSGIYGIINTMTGDFYIGSAVTNKFYSRFYKHLIKGLGNKKISIDLNQYGIDSFAFFILEYYPEEVTKKNNPNLMILETNWIQTYLPSYNILLEAGNSLGYTHSEEIKQKMKDNYSDLRKEQIGSLNRGKQLSDSVRLLLREKALNRTDEVKNKYRLASSKPVTASNKDGTVFMRFTGIRIMAQHFECDPKTIRKFIENEKLFRNEWSIRLEE